MEKYKIYAGLGGGFGGETLQGIWKYHDIEEAEADAYQKACEIFEAQIGLGMDGYEEWRNEAESEIDDDDLSPEEYEDAISEYMTQIEEDARESWIEYHVEKVADDYDETYDSEE